MTEQAVQQQNSLPDQEDQALVARFRDGDNSAFDALIQKYTRRAYSMALRYTRQSTDAEDMVQEAFLKAYRHFDQFDDTCNFSSWFFRILINHCLNFLKRERRRRFIFDSWRIGNTANFEQMEERYLRMDNTPDRQLQQKETKRQIHDALKRLPDKQREAIVLYDLEGFSQQEVSEILDCPVGSVMSRIYYGRKKLKEYLARYFAPAEKSDL
jgi:RNA polymerase sigma-70 factor, ECF subfamily